MKCLGISNFLGEISSFSHSIGFLYFFALTSEEGFLTFPCILWNSTFKCVYLPEASVRNSAPGKGHEEGGSAYTKAGSSLRSPPGNSRASTPKTRVCLLYYFVLSPTPLTLQGAVCPPPALSEKELT